MDNQTQAEIERCQQFLERTDLSARDRDMAERGLDDWFWESIWDEMEAFCAAKDHLDGTLCR